ncbi:MAG: hypothetical protein NC818_02740 [Candidatus Omnitrophica bacterium]|nr:hypothetical protein [Candidatus Omnitrophota bacterium]
MKLKVLKEIIGYLELVILFSLFLNRSNLLRDGAFIGIRRVKEVLQTQVRNRSRELVGLFKTENGLGYKIYREEILPLMLAGPSQAIPFTVEMRAMIAEVNSDADSGEEMVAGRISLYIPQIPYINIAEIEVNIASPYKDSGILNKLFSLILKEARNRGFSHLRMATTSLSSGEIFIFLKQEEAHGIISHLTFYPLQDGLVFIGFDIANRE